MLVAGLDLIWSGSFLWCLVRWSMGSVTCVRWLQIWMVVTGVTGFKFLSSEGWSWVPLCLLHTRFCRAPASVLIVIADLACGMCLCFLRCRRAMVVQRWIKGGAWLIVRGYLDWLWLFWSCQIFWAELLVLDWSWISSASTCDLHLDNQPLIYFICLHSSKFEVHGKSDLGCWWFSRNWRLSGEGPILLSPWWRRSFLQLYQSFLSYFLHNWTSPTLVSSALVSYSVLMQILTWMIYNLQFGSGLVVYLISTTWPRLISIPSSFDAWFSSFFPSNCKIIGRSLAQCRS